MFTFTIRNVRFHFPIFFLYVYITSCIQQVYYARVVFM